MMESIQARTKLANGVEMPFFGLGVYQADEGKEVVDAVKVALKAGYRSIDTASFYKNEEGVGQAIRESNVPREELFVTTKVWNDEQGYDETLAAFERSRKRLGLDVIDLYLIHWPMKGKYLDTWRALETLYKEEKVRAIGVSNFNVHHLEAVMEISNINPMVDQVEFHPFLTQAPLREFCRQHEIQVEAWRPLTKGVIFTHPVVQSLAQSYGKTPAQIVLRWNLQHRVVTIPKSVRAERIRENADIFDFQLCEEDMGKLDALNENRRLGQDPDSFSR
ncbi:aldo/keto reductase [Shouchella lonarensis]|uniref:Aldo/keto reductase n=1 Tax=Shouchella lonarensis TaxID=1464122 RepID=A0A1G6HB48_9BACI|nr:aldo/keto reductase [Shouchella lonarensis]SDB91421.1 Aldo/keto reductase [Shouchella lonarensis]